MEALIPKSQKKYHLRGILCIASLLPNIGVFGRGLGLFPWPLPGSLDVPLLFPGSRHMVASKAYFLWCSLGGDFIFPSRNSLFLAPQPLFRFIALVSLRCPTLHLVASACNLFMSSLVLAHKASSVRSHNCWELLGKSIGSWPLLQSCHANTPAVEHLLVMV